MVLAGEPGIGKTSLLAELVHRAQERGCLVLEGSAAELERDLPFGLVVDAFDAYLESLDARSYDRLAADDLGELASVFPSLRSLGSGTTLETTVSERFRAHHAVRELIERLAARQPLLLAFDDVHWSDGASLELLTHLLRRRPEAAVMVAAAFRSGQVPPALAATVEAAVRHGDIDRVVLGPLGPDAAGTLVAVDGSAERERLYRDSGGNPFYLLQLARADDRPEAGAADTDGWGSEGVPHAVTAAIATELAALPEPVRRFAEAAAVAGDPFELDLAVAAAAIPEEDALGALDELAARDLLRAGDVPRRFRFRHPLVRSAVYASCSPGVRLTTHERIAAALAARGAPAASRAHHVEQSAHHGDPDAVAVLHEAGRSAAQRAPSSAAGWFEAALRILPSSTDPAERAELLIALAEAQAAIGRLEASRTALLETLELIPSGRQAQRLKLISACATVEQLLGRQSDAHARLLGALDELPDRDSVEGASLMIDLAWDAGLDERHEQMLEWALEALDTARPLGDQALTATAAAIVALAASWTAPDRAETYRAEAVALVDALPDDVLAQSPRALQWLSSAELFLNRFGDGITHALRGLEIVRATGQGGLLPALTQSLAGSLIITGRLAEAASLLDDAVDRARLTDNGWALSWSLGTRCWAAAMEGDVETALDTGEEAMTLTRDLQGRLFNARVHLSFSTALLQAGRLERAREVLAQGGGGEGMPRLPRLWRVYALELLTRCLLQLDRRDDAERAAALARQLAAEFDLPYSSALGDRAVAAVVLASGDAATAADLALASAARAEEVSARVDAALSRTLAGRALAAAGRDDEAAAELERAAAELEACGALRHRDEAEHELRKLGRAVHRRTRPGKTDGAGVESLTGRELEIARLVVARRTNPQIAAELFLSIKTVESHMRNIFRKLDVDSRVDVAHIVEQTPAP